MRAPGCRAPARERLLALAAVAPLALAGAGCAWLDPLDPWIETIESIRLRPPASAPSSPASSPPQEPERRSQVYVVRPGDTLGAIAARHGVTVWELTRANALANANRIEAGQALVIPHGSESAPPPVSLARPRSATPVRAARAPRARAALDARVQRADELLRTARFEEALAEAERARADLTQLEAGGGADARAQHVRLELLAGTAAVALGDDAEATQSFERALKTDPALRLDPARFAPKVIRHFEQTRLRLAQDLPVPESRLADLAAP